MAPDLIIDRIAHELRAMASATEELAAALCEDEQVAMRCLPLLQRFDLLAQQQAELAALIVRLAQGGCAQQALDGVRLAALAARLGRAA